MTAPLRGLPEQTLIIQYGILELAIESHPRLHRFGTGTAGSPSRNSRTLCRSPLHRTRSCSPPGSLHPHQTTGGSSARARRAAGVSPGTADGRQSRPGQTATTRPGAGRPSAAQPPQAEASERRGSSGSSLATAGAPSPQPNQMSRPRARTITGRPETLPSGCGASGERPCPDRRPADRRRPAGPAGSHPAGVPRRGDDWRTNRCCRQAIVEVQHEEQAGRSSRPIRGAHQAPGEPSAIRN